MRFIVIKIKNVPDGLNSRLEMTAEWIRECEDRSPDMSQSLESRQEQGWRKMSRASETHATMSGSLTHLAEAPQRGYKSEIANFTRTNTYMYTYVYIPIHSKSKWWTKYASRNTSRNKLLKSPPTIWQNEYRHTAPKSSENFQKHLYIVFAGDRRKKEHYIWRPVTKIPTDFSERVEAMKQRTNITFKSYYSLLTLFNQFCVCGGYVCMNAGDYGGQRHQAPLELELQRTLRTAHSEPVESFLCVWD